MASTLSKPAHIAIGEFVLTVPSNFTGISQTDTSPKDFMEAGKRRLAGDTARAANSDEVRDLRKEARDLKEVVAEQTLEMRYFARKAFAAIIGIDVEDVVR